MAMEISGGKNYLRKVLADEVKCLSDMDLQLAYKYYSERKNKLCKKEKVYLEVLEAEAYKRVNKCPSCWKPLFGYPAISRKDNKTEICAECGNREAVNQWIEHKFKEQANDNK